MRTLAALVFLALSSATASAQGYDVETEVPYIPPPSDDRPPEPRRHWYGWQMLLADSLIAPPLMLAADGIDNAALRMTASFGAFAATGTAVHLMNGETDRALTTALVRTTPIAVLVAVDALADDGEGGPSGLVLGTAVLMGLGISAYYVWEIGWHTTQVERPVRAVDGTWTFSAAPTPGGGGQLGVVGVF